MGSSPTATAPMFVAYCGFREYSGCNGSSGNVKVERFTHFLRDAFRKERKLFLYVYKKSVGTPSSHFLNCDFIHSIEEHSGGSSRTETMGAHLGGINSNCPEVESRDCRL